MKRGNHCLFEATEIVTIVYGNAEFLVVLVLCTNVSFVITFVYKGISIVNIFPNVRGVSLIWLNKGFLVQNHIGTILKEMRCINYRNH